MRLSFFCIAILISGVSLPAAERAGQARCILAAWEEEDCLTRLKLFALLEAATRREERLPSLLRPLYENLALPQQRRFEISSPG